MLLLLTFMKRAVIIQNYKNKVMVNAETTLYILDILKKNIKESDKENFLYKGKNSDIFIINENIISSVGNSVLYKSGGASSLLTPTKPQKQKTKTKKPKGYRRHDNLAIHE